MFDSRPNHHNTMASHAAVLEHPPILPVSCILQGSCTAVAVFFLYSVFFLSYFGSFTPPEQTLHGCYSRQRKGKKAEKPSESCRLRGVCVVILCIYFFFFFQCCRLPGERKAGKVRTDPFAQDQQLRASACLVFALCSCTSSVPRLWCGPARG